MMGFLRLAYAVVVVVFADINPMEAAARKRFVSQYYGP